MNRYLIVAHDTDVTQQNLIHERVKHLADEWWHELPEVWAVVGGESSRWWRDDLRVFVPNPPSGLLVFKVAEGSDRWSTRTTLTKNWFSDHL